MMSDLQAHGNDASRCSVADNCTTMCKACIAWPSRARLCLRCKAYIAWPSSVQGVQACVQVLLCKCLKKAHKAVCNAATAMHQAVATERVVSKVVLAFEHIDKRI